jgi:hypothetical protein
MTAKTSATFDAMSTDDLARITMALVQEVWIMRDRMAITEKLLEEKAGITPAMIDDYPQSPETRAELERLRALYVNRTIGAPMAARQRSVTDILARNGFTATP